jgi:two-component system, OmpR family, sensor histidine kinase TctE
LTQVQPEAPQTQDLAAFKLASRPSLRRQLLAGVLVPVLVLVSINSALLYQQALKAAHTAYDRTLLATAKSLGEMLALETMSGGTLQVRATLPYAALDAFEADNRSRLYFHIAGFQQETVLGFEDLPRWRGPLPERDHHGYSALVHFYDARYRNAPVRMAVLLQPVASDDGQGMATVQVAETLELRETLARQLLIDTLWREALVMALIAAVVFWVVQRATRPVRTLASALVARREDDLSPLMADQAPRELAQVVDAANQLLGRVRQLVDHQKRFVRDASHQLRTPLAVLKVQVQSARRGDVSAEAALAEIEQTTESATRVANQMLALAKVEQLHQEGISTEVAWAPIVRDVSLDLAPLMAQRDLNFDIQWQDANVSCHEWGLRELTRNLLHNAIKHSPHGARLRVALWTDARHAALSIEDEGPGLTPDMQQRLFEPFATGNPRDGSGLGLAICQAIVTPLGGSVSLENRTHQGRHVGLTAVVRLPLATLAAK